MATISYDELKNAGTIPNDAKVWNVSDREAQKALAAKLHGIAVEDLVVGVHIGPEEANGVGTIADFQGYTAILKVDNPTDGINDGAKYVTYFKKEGKLYKAINADPSTLEELTSGAEYTLARKHY